MDLKQLLQNVHIEELTPMQRATYKACIDNNDIILLAPTGSGKTTQLPLILHEAGYSENGVIGVTQPRRIAALSVTEYINKQLDSTIKAEKGEQNSTGRLAAYKIRFEDNTDISTKIKIKLYKSGTILFFYKSKYKLYHK